MLTVIVMEIVIWQEAGTVNEGFMTVSRFGFKVYADTKDGGRQRKIEKKEKWNV